MTLRAHWTHWRNRVLADSRFQRFAARFPLTRPVARNRARRLFDLVAGFTYSQTLAALVETGWLDLLAAAPVETARLAAHADLSHEAAERLLRAAAALDLIELLPANGSAARWTLGEGGAALRGNSGIVEMVRHHRHLYADLADPLALLRRGGGGSLADYWHYARGEGDGGAAAVANYSVLMAASQPLVADQVIDAYPFARHACVMDMGGGEGAFLARLADRVPGPRLALVDLPSVVARARIGLATLGERVEFHPGSFLTEPLPTCADCITLIRVLHDHDDQPALKLLHNIFAALPSGGVLVLAEPMADASGARPMGDTYFGWYLLAMGSGRPRRADEITAMLTQAGFTQIRRRTTAIPVTSSMIVARKPQL